MLKNLTDEYVEKIVYDILRSRPCRAVELRLTLKERGIMISYGRLKRILNEMLESGKIKYRTEGASIIYHVQG